MSDIKIITLEDIKYTVFAVVRETLSWDEPIPEFETRYKNSLESCVAMPFQKFNNKFLYKGLCGKAAILFYLMIKNHPFQNGNKRMALMSLLMFLYLNDKWLRVDANVLYNMTIWIAESPSEAKDQLIDYIEKFVKKNLIEFEI